MRSSYRRGALPATKAAASGRKSLSGPSGAVRLRRLPLRPNAADPKVVCIRAGSLPWTAFSREESALDKVPTFRHESRVGQPASNYNLRPRR